MCEEQVNLLGFFEEMKVFGEDADEREIENILPTFNI